MDAQMLFQETLTRHLRHASLLEKRNWWMAIVRFLWFVLGIGLLFAGFGTSAFLIILLIWSVIFVSIITWHERLRERKRFSTNIVSLCAEELRRLDGDRSGIEDGDQFRDETHPYSNDLDIFGRDSLFQHLNRCTLPPSKHLLSEWLKKPENESTVISRQNAIKELKEKIPWLLEFRSHLVHHGDPSSKKLDLRPTQIPRHFQLASFFMPVVSLTIATLWIINVLPVTYLIFSMLINGIILRRFQVTLHALDLSVSEMYSTITLYLKALKHITKTDFNSDLLVGFSTTIVSRTLVEFHRLSQLAYLLSTRSNFFYQILNSLLLLDIHSLKNLNKWILKNRTQYAQWIDTVHKMEVLGSMATFAYTNDNYVFPVMSRKSVFRAIAIGHPLIPPGERITNDLEIKNEKILLITGSNMSGKSTFLRTVGINMVMAWVGMPVCAREFQTGRFEIYTSMRTEDNLREHTSSFYAELKRIRGLLDEIEKSETPILYMLDEILKGTNSHDRHKGAMGLINFLLKKQGLGLISTHDLDLSRVYIDHGSVRNLSFNSEFLKDEITFDYTLREGPCLTTNATELMKSMGILT